MTTKQINQSIEKMKIYLTSREKIEYWLNFIFILAPLSFVGYITIDTAIQNQEFSLLTLILLGILISLLSMLLKHKLNSTKLDGYKSRLTVEQFIEANEATAKLNDWFILSNTKSHFSAIKGTNWQWEGIKISAILKDDKVYLNSMVSPSIRSNPFTFGLNKKNELELIRQYQLILKGHDVNEMVDDELAKREEEFWNKSEWTIKSILIRFFLYGFFFFLIILGIFIIYSEEAEILIAVIIPIFLCSIYIYQDVKILREKRKRRKSKNR